MSSVWASFSGSAAANDVRVSSMTTVVPILTGQRIPFVIGWYEPEPRAIVVTDSNAEHVSGLLDSGIDEPATRPVGQALDIGVLVSLNRGQRGGAWTLRLRGPSHPTSRP